MSSALKRVLVLGVALIAAVIAGSVGVFIPSDMTPITPWALFSTILLVWFSAFVVGLTLSSSAGWLIGGIGCILGGVAVTAYGRAEGATIPLVVGAGIVVFTILLTFLQDRLQRSHKQHC